MALYAAFQPDLPATSGTRFGSLLPVWSAALNSLLLRGLECGQSSVQLACPSESETIRSHMVPSWDCRRGGAILEFLASEVAELWPLLYGYLHCHEEVRSWRC
ncbi:hypothetical protein ElyMa_003615900 [Elysia marginata]|uniref:Uncharacterized protein n=1 Tax=Elysia marginata TaxID=1093978 RepID=A0AAV4ES23_9GAST|nr:hypothetical protein ElyMa_003615900 [Elysia marginata]